MPFTIRPYRRFRLPLVVIRTFCILALYLPTFVQAETKTIISAATYVMGDGETPTFAEAMVLQRAKQMALEQAGTYVESYSKIQSLELNTEEIQTIAGGVLETEVLKKDRKLVGDGVRFDVRIKATVTTDKMEELAQRIKGKNVAGEYRKLQEEYARLTKEIETWKQLIAKSPPGPERDAALEQIRVYEKAFGSVQKDEGALFQRLVRGEALVIVALDNKAVVDQLVQTIIKEGEQVEVGEAKAHAVASKSGQLLLVIPVSIRISDTLIPAVSHVVGKLNGLMRPEVRLDNSGEIFIDEMFRVGSKNSISAIGTLGRLAEDYQTAAYFQTAIRSSALELRFSSSMGQTTVCVLPLLAGPGHLDGGYYNRLFPVIRIDDPRRGRHGIDGLAESEWGLLRATRSTMCKDLQGKTAECRVPVDDEAMQEIIDSKYGSDPGAGFVVILHEPAMFRVQILLPQEEVRNLKQIAGRVVEASKGVAQPKGLQAECRIAP